MAAAPAAGPVSERRLLQRMPTWPLAAGRSPSASPPPACKRDMAARRATVGRRAGVFLVFLLAIYYFYRECLGGQYSMQMIPEVERLLSGQSAHVASTNRNNLFAMLGSALRVYVMPMSAVPRR